MGGGPRFRVALQLLSHLSYSCGVMGGGVPPSLALPSQPCVVMALEVCGGGGLLRKQSKALPDQAVEGGLEVACDVPHNRAFCRMGGVAFLEEVECGGGEA